VEAVDNAGVVGESPLLLRQTNGRMERDRVRNASTIPKSAGNYQVLICREAFAGGCGGKRKFKEYSSSDTTLRSGGSGGKDT